MRLDKYLKVSRIIKRRTVANEACDSGRVMLNDKVARASADVKVGDVIEIAFGNKTVKVRITSVQETIRKEDAKEMFEYLYEENQLEQQQYVLLTMTGMGDIFFNYENVAAFLLQAGIKENLHVTLSSCLWNDQLLDKVKLLCGDVHIRNIQITYVSDDSEKAMEIIPFYKNLTYDFHKIVSYIERHTESYYRINYIVIKGVNDSEEDVHRFSQVIKTIRNKVVVRVSQLNETGATKRNQLQTTDVSVLEHLQQILQRDGIKSYVFYAHKNDNMNCGQLITEKWGK